MRKWVGFGVVWVVSVMVAGCPERGWAARVGSASLASVKAANSRPVRTHFSNSTNPSSGLRGWHIDRDSHEKTPHGISLDIDGAPVWDMGIDYELPDLILAYSHVTESDQFRLRADNGQLEIGARVGHPVTQSQVNVTAGTPQAPLDGVGVGCFGSKNGLYLYQKLPGSKRTKINLCDLFQIGTDSQQNGTADFWIFNNQTGRFPLMISTNDLVTLGHGAKIGGALRHTGRTAGFFGATPVTRPTVGKSRKDGTALADLLSSLAALGLIVDKTTQ